ncbi:MAG TPA: exopolysaccharide biosynthesis polyprenyl glycosylphosphotransferase [Lachnospiraceae bacterium]|nr:exopolysaccharide biosynthesis polyprenyl glycosylphosphotransferase [Lachnospiraceae bacterium]HAV00348.1 exopolysaccharide biosynthesis polyprenyl glycosylphosphotransferase [Lachnospiraceae bacterium]
MPKTTQMKKRIYSFFMAFLIVAAESGIMAFVWVAYYNHELPKAYYFWGHIFISVVYMIILFLISIMYGGLKIGSYRMLELTFSQIFSTIITNILFYLIIVLLAYHFPSPFPVIGVTLLQCFVICGWVFMATMIYRRLFPPLNILLVYGGKQKDRFVEKVKTRRHQFSITVSMNAEEEELESIYKEIDAHEAVMFWDVPVNKRNSIFKYCYERSVEIYTMPRIIDIILLGSATLHLFDTPLLLTKGSPLEFEQLLFKRLLDLVLSLVLIILLSPVMLITALCIKLYDRGPVLYKQIRVTLDNREFYIYKFRSMIVDAEKDGTARLATRHDDRITPVGRVIRKVRIDELPQLLNVLSGDMSFVGPRPERPEIIKQYMKDMPEFSYRTKVKAGITGYAQIYGKYNTLPYDKLKLDLFYIENYSIWLDLKLIILTVKILFTPESTEGIEDGKVTALIYEDRTDD